MSRVRRRIRLTVTAVFFLFFFCKFENTKFTICIVRAISERDFRLLVFINSRYSTSADREAVQ